MPQQFTQQAASVNAHKVIWYPAFLVSMVSKGSVPEFLIVLLPLLPGFGATLEHLFDDLPVTQTHGVSE